MSAAEAYGVVKGGYAVPRPPEGAVFGLWAGRSERPILFVVPNDFVHDDEDLSAKDSETLKRAVLSGHHEPAHSAISNAEGLHGRWKSLFRFLTAMNASVAILGFLAMGLAWNMGHSEYVIPAAIVAFGFTLLWGITLEATGRAKRYKHP